MRQAVIIMVLVAIAAIPLFAQEDRCDFNSNGVNDVADLTRIMIYLGGDNSLNDLPKYWADGDCDCDDLHLTITDSYALAERLIHGYGNESQGSQIYSDSDIISMPALQATPGQELEIPLYIETARDLIGLQFYVRFESNLIGVTGFEFSETLPGDDSNVYLFDEGLSVYALLSEESDFDGFAGYIHAVISPDVPVGTQIGLNFGNDPHRALYTGLADAEYGDESRVVELHFIHPDKVDGIIHVVEGGLRDRHQNPISGFSAFPNPFNISTRISFSIAQDSNVRVEVYDMLGRRVSALVNESLSAGIHSTVWRADQVPSGVYFCRVTAGRNSLTTRLTLLK